MYPHELSTAVIAGLATAFMSACGGGAADSGSSADHRARGDGGAPVDLAAPATDAGDYAEPEGTEGTPVMPPEGLEGLKEGDSGVVPPGNSVDAGAPGSSGDAGATPEDAGGGPTETSGDGGAEGAEGEPPAAPSPMVVMTFNVLCSFCNPDFDPWTERLAYFQDLFNRHQPDLIGTQELFSGSEVKQFLKLLPGFQALYFTNDEMLKEYPDETIFYREDRFELVENGYYWLSPEPDTPWSTGFSPAGQLFRLVGWAKFIDKPSGQAFVFVNTHFDNNPPSQDLSAALLLERTAPWAAALPVIAAGDFNSQTYDPAYKALTTAEPFHFLDAFDLAEAWSIATNQDSPPAYDAPGRIDHIFLAGASWSVPWWRVDMTVYGPKNLYPSDHFAIAAQVQWLPNGPARRFTASGGGR